MCTSLIPYPYVKNSQRICNFRFCHLLPYSFISFFHSSSRFLSPSTFFPSIFSSVYERRTRSFRAILHERSKRRVCNASQNAWQRQPNFQRRKYTYARSNLHERFARLQFGVSPASSVSNAVRGVVNASVRNVVQSTLGVSFDRPSVAFVRDVRCGKIFLRGGGAPRMNTLPHDGVLFRNIFAY